MSSSSVAVAVTHLPMAPVSQLLSAVPSECRVERKGTEAFPLQSRAVSARRDIRGTGGLLTGSRNGVGAVSLVPCF